MKYNNRYIKNQHFINQDDQLLECKIRIYQDIAKDLVCSNNDGELIFVRYNISEKVEWYIVNNSIPIRVTNRDWICELGSDHYRKIFANSKSPHMNPSFQLFLQLHESVLCGRLEKAITYRIFEYLSFVDGSTDGQSNSFKQYKLYTENEELVASIDVVHKFLSLIVPEKDTVQLDAIMNRARGEFGYSMGYDFFYDLLLNIKYHILNTSFLDVNIS
ncbi:hypothetical protein GJ496_009189 [Pomphorhynchus laevis]|nr:hypothetical protein GJ496_009189 [Pomphorhynchus laevis]